VKRISAISVLFLAALTLGEVISAVAQKEDRCLLTLNMVREGGVGGSLYGVAGKATSIDGKEIIKGIHVGTSLVFDGLLNNATYTFVVENADYKSAVIERSIRCSPGMSGTISMVSGDPMETYKTAGRFDGTVKAGDGYIKLEPMEEFQNVQAGTPKIISKDIMNGDAISLPKPKYPADAKAAGANGVVNVQVVVDEAGNVTSASALTGNSLLRQSSIEAARGAKFKPVLLSGIPDKVRGIIVYNFQ
jgi:TonB family protein